MRRLTLLTVLVLSLLSTTVFAGWTKVSENMSGDTFYVDFERIKKRGGYVYFWRLRDYLKPDKWGDMSAKVYYQGDCKLFRWKDLSYSFHKEPMGGGTGDINTLKQDWKYPSPDSVNELILKRVCAYTK